MRLRWQYVIFTVLAAVTRPAAYASPPGGDLGQYMYSGWVLLHGGSPYTDAANNKGPANFLLFAAIRAVCGHSTAAVRVLLVLLTGLAAVAVAGIVTHHADRAAGFVGGCTFALLSSAEAFEGSDPNNTQFGVVAMVGAWYLATRDNRRAPFAAGALLAFACWMNPAFGVAIPFVVWELWRRRPWLSLAAGFASVTLPLLVWVGVTGGLEDMLTQVFGKVSRTVSSRVGGGSAESVPGEPHPPLEFLLDLPAGVLWIAGAVGAALAIRDRALRPLGIAAAAWMVLAWLRVEVAGYAFVNQYVPALVGISIAIAAGLAATRARPGLAVLVIAPLVWVAVLDPQLRLLGVPATERGNTYAQPVADFIASHTADDARIVVAEYDPQIYWLADRRASSRFFDSYGLAGQSDYVAARRRDLEEHPPAAIAAGPERLIDPDLKRVIDSGAYRIAFERDGARVWLRSPP